MLQSGTCALMLAEGNNASFIINGQSFVPYTNAIIVGSMGCITYSSGLYLTSGDLPLTVIPEPAAPVLFSVVPGFLMLRRRRQA
jgi:hypothetical protein